MVKFKTDWAQQGRELAAEFENFSIRIEDDTEKKLHMAAKRVHSGAVKLTPVDTGQLKNSLAIRQIGSGKDVVFEVGTKVPYAKFVEYGTRKQKAQPFLGKSLDMNMEYIRKQLQDILKK